MENLAQLMDGNADWVLRLQEMFDENKFVLYNKPDIAYPYLFTYFKGESWRSRKAIRHGINKNFNPTPGGLPGNDDCGTLSAWYVFSAPGFYPVDPTSGNLRLGDSLFKKVILISILNIIKVKNSKSSIKILSKKRIIPSQSGMLEEILDIRNIEKPAPYLQG